MRLSFFYLSSEISYLHIAGSYGAGNKKIRKYNNVDISLKNRKNSFSANYFPTSAQGFNLVLWNKENILNAGLEKKCNLYQRQSRLRYVQTSGKQCFLSATKGIYFSTNCSFLFLTNYFNYFFSRAHLDFQAEIHQNSCREEEVVSRLSSGGYKTIGAKISPLLVSIVPGTAGVLRYLSRKLNANFSSVFVPDIFTNLSVYKLTEFYENGVDFQFFLENQQTNVCWFFSSENSKDYLVFKHLLKSIGFFISFTRNEEIMGGSDVYFPLEVSDASELLGASLFLSTLFKK